MENTCIEKKEANPENVKKRNSRSGLIKDPGGRHERFLTVASGAEKIRSVIKALKT